MRFDDWMIKTGTSNAAFGDKLDCSGETIRRYRNGTRDPGTDEMAEIFHLTGGEVTPNDWAGVGPRSAAEEARSCPEV